MHFVEKKLIKRLIKIKSKILEKFASLTVILLLENVTNISIKNKVLVLCPA